MIKRLAMFSLLGFVMALVPAAGAAAQSYNGTTVQPEGDGKTYKVAASNGDTVTLANVGNGSISVTFANDVDGSIVVEQSSSRPAGAPSNPPGTVAIYFDVTLNGIAEGDIGSATWTFTVSKDFLNQNNVTAENVFLYRYDGSGWQQLSVSEQSSDASSVTFTATSSGFSVFAVSAVPGLSNTGSPYLIGAVIGIVTLAVVGGAFFFSRRQRA